MRKIISILALILLILPVTEGQKITVNADSYKQMYEGGGISYGLYKGHVWSMSEANQNKYFQLLFGDIKMKYIQYYAKTHPATDAGEYDKVTTFIEKSWEHRPDAEVIFVLGSFPDDMTIVMNVDGTDKDVLDVGSPDIYDRVAEWMLEMMNAMYERGTPVDIFSMANEPDWQKQWKFGYESAKVGLAILTEESIPKLHALLDDPEQNPYGLEYPQIMAPATIGPGGCYNYITYWKENHPIAWEQVDIVATHQYVGGDNWNSFNKIQQELDGRRFMQTEQHVSKGDGLGELPIEAPHRGALSMMSLFNASVNNGVESWFYFVPNYPNDYHNGGIMQVSWGGEPLPYKTYHAFKQLNSVQSDSSHVLGRSLSGADNTRVVAMRKVDENKAVIHIASINSAAVSMEIEIQDAVKTYGITSVKLWETDADSDMEMILDMDYDHAFKSIFVNLSPWSLVSLELEFDPEGYTSEMLDQEITFPAIPDQKIGDAQLTLEATASSGLEVSFEVLSGPASIEGNILTFLDLGRVEIMASQQGGGEYGPAESVSRNLFILPDDPNIALGKTATASSLFADFYSADKAVDGNREHNDYRWVSSQDEALPQWIEIDLAEEYNINALAFWTGFSGYNHPISDFMFQAWANENWQALLYITGNTQSEYLASYNEVQTDKVRLYIFGGVDPVVRLYELEVYGTPVVSVDEALSSLLTIYPNPANGVLNIKGLDHDHNTSLEILDQSGRIMLMQELGGPNASLDVSFLMPGYYLVRIGEHDSAITKKLLIQ